MLRVLWFAIKIGLFAAAAIWLAGRPGTMSVHWLGYDVQAEIGPVLMVFLLALFVLLSAHRLLLGVLAIPRRLRRFRNERKRQRGQRALALGLTAVAAGDAKQAGLYAYRARHFLPKDKGLTYLLEGQAARLKGDDVKARESFTKLLRNKDTAFLGLRGLLLSALEQGDHWQARDLAQQALKLHPSQPWILRIVYGLELRQRQWEDSRRMLKRLERYKALPPEKIQSDRIALLLQEAEEFRQTGHDGQALARLKQAWKLDETFVPSALALARHYLDHGNRRAAAQVIERIWRDNPHPQLVPLWRDAMPKSYRKEDSGRLRWLERLVALRPQSMESQLAVAEEALSQNLWGAARQYLGMAETIGSSARLYQIWARLAEAQENQEEARDLWKRAGEATPEKVWTCSETGRIYENWAPVAVPHGAFNTMIWGYPQTTKSDPAIFDRTELLINAPR